MSFGYGEVFLLSWLTVYHPRESIDHLGEREREREKYFPLVWGGGEI